MSPATRTPASRSGRSHAGAGHAPGRRAPAAAARRSLAGLPGVLRPAGGELPHRHRADHERRLRLHGDAHQPAARRGAHARRRGVRRLAHHVPLRALRRLQGQPEHHARRLPRPGRPHQGRPDGAGDPVLRGRELRGRRHHRHPRHAGRGAGLPGAGHHGRPRRVPAGQRQRHGALPDARGLRAGPDRPGRGDDPLRAHPGAVPGLRGAARRPERQPAQHPGRRGEDGRQVGARVRLARGADGPGGRGQGQGGRRAAGEPRARAAEPPAHRADPGRPARGGAGRPRGPPVGPRGRAPAVRRAGVPGAARAPVRHADQRRAGGGGGLRGRGRRARARHRAGVARRARARRAPGRARRARAAGHVGGPRRRGDRAGRGEPSLEARAAGASAGAAQAAYLDVRTLLPDDEAALGEWLADPAVPKAAHDVKAALHGLRARGWDLERADQRHRAGRLPGAARAAQLRPRRPRAALPAPRAARRRASRRTASFAAAAARRRPTPPARRRRSCRRSAVAELADALDAELAGSAARALLAELELPLQGVLADLETAGVAVDREALADAGGRVRARRSSRPRRTRTA